MALVAGHMRAQGAVPKVRGREGGGLCLVLSIPPPQFCHPPHDAPSLLLQAVGFIVPEPHPFAGGAASPSFPLDSMLPGSCPLLCLCPLLLILLPSEV